MESAATANELVGLALELAATLDPRTVMGRILERGLAIAAADRATLSSLHDDTLRIEATVGVEGEVTWVGRVYGLDVLERQPLVRELIARRRTVLGGPMQTSTAMPEFREALGHVQHTANVPVIADSRVVGMLVLSRYGDVPFTESDTPVLDGLGALAGLALRNARMYEDAIGARRRAQAAAAAAADIAQVQDLPALLEKLIEHACEAAGADSGSVMRLEDGEGVIEATSGVAPVGSRWPFGAEVDEAIREGRPAQIIAGAKEVDPELTSYTAPYGRALIEPLQFGGEVLGILVLGRHHGRGEFSPAEIAALGEFAGLAAVVLRNGRLVHRLRETEKMKREFIDIAVHELRGPLTVIEGYTELLIRDQASSLDTESVRQLTTIRGQAGHARGLAEDLMVLARVESNDIGVANDPLDLGEEVRLAVERVQPRARLRGGTVTAHVGGSAVWACGDRGLAARVLDNLLSNAVAYAVEKPRVEVETSAVNGYVLVRVTDNGPGVIEDERERIFARFARGTHIGGTRGSGLGLYLSRECARRMRGDVVLEDTHAGGSTFLLTLPAVAGSPAGA